MSSIEVSSEPLCNFVCLFRLHTIAIAILTKCVFRKPVHNNVFATRLLATF